MFTYLILLVPTFIVSGGAAYFKTRLNSRQKNSRTKNSYKSVFDVPSLFSIGKHKNQFYTKWNTMRISEEAKSRETNSFGDSGWNEDLSNIAKNFDFKKYRYTHITKRMNLVIAH
jgi:hypothetical protein